MLKIIYTILFFFILVSPISNVNAKLKLIVLDRSCSMSMPVKQIQGHKTRYDIAVNEIRQDIRNDLKSKNKIILILFNHKLICCTIDSLNTFDKYVNEYKPNGRTNIGDTLWFAYNKIRNIPYMTFGHL